VRWVLGVELGASLVAAMVFIAAFGDPRRAIDKTIAWHLWSFSVVVALADATLLALLFGAKPPVWIYPLVYGAQAGVVVQRAYLALKPRCRWRIRRARLSREKQE
jgi:hypothetical protein